MNGEIQQMQKKISEVLTRLEKLEKQVEDFEPAPEWTYLVVRPHPWRRQLCVKGRNLTVGQLISTIKANKLTVTEASEDLSLPRKAIEEALRYYEENRALIELEATEERRKLMEKGYSLEPKNIS